jgi:hypothetical protein
MKRAAQLFVLCLMPLLLAGCAGGRGNSGPTGTIDRPTLNPNSYSFKCSTPPSVNDWSAELNAIQPQAPIAPRLIVQLPPAGKDQASACANAQLEARIEALRRAQLFGDIVVRHEGVAGFPPADRTEDGYWMWVENGALVVSYGQAMRSALPFNAQRLELWVKGLKPSFDNMKKMADKESLAVSTVSVGASNYYGYRGVEYIAFSDLRAAMLAHAEEIAQKTTKVKEVGQSLLILTPPESAVVAVWSKSMQNAAVPNAGTNLGLITGTNTYANLQSAAKAVERSGLFRKTTLREEDATDPDFTGYDAVLWIRSADNGKWYVHLKGHKALQFKTLVTPEPDKWIEKVSAAIADARADKPSSDIDTAPAAPADGKKPLSFNIDGIIYNGLDQVSEALKAKCDKLLGEVGASGGNRYSSLLLVLPTHATTAKNVVSACLPGAGSKGPAKCEQSDEEKNAITGFMNAINDADHDCMASVIQKSALFKSVLIVRDREVADGEFNGSAYKLYQRPFSSAGPASWMLAAQGGGSQLVPGTTVLSLAKSGDEQKLVQNLQAALDKLH